MKTISKTLVLAGLGLALIGLPVLAQQATEAPPPGQPMHAEGEDHGGGWGWGRGHGGKHGGGKHGGHRGMMMIDVNNDGLIGTDEAAALADGMFTRHDQNSDGALSEAEFSTPPHGRSWFGRGDKAAEHETRLKAMFVKLDADKNASVSKAEAFAEAQALYAAADADKDGKVTPWEIRMMPRP